MKCEKEREYIPAETARQMRCSFEEKDSLLSVCLLPSGPSELLSHIRPFLPFPVKCHHMYVGAVSGRPNTAQYRLPERILLETEKCRSTFRVLNQYIEIVVKVTLIILEV